MDSTKINDFKKGLGPESEIEKEVQKELKTLTVDAVKKMLKVDLGCCILLLQTLHDDPTVFDMVATAIHGSYMNKKHKRELDEQLALDLKGEK